MKLQRVTKGTVLTTALLAGMLFFTAAPVFAGEITADVDEGKVYQIAIPDENGGLQYYTREEAQKLYDEIQEQTEDKLLEKMDAVSGMETDQEKENAAVSAGMFRYKYRFVTDSSGMVYGTAERLTNYLDNQTSVNQPMKIAPYIEESWSIDTELTGRYKEAFFAAVGEEWKNTSTFSTELTLDVPAKHCVWLEFQPRYHYVKGKVQKYYVNRGPKKVTVIQESKPVYSKSIKTVLVNFDGKEVEVPDGVYIWKESGSGQ